MGKICAIKIVYVWKVILVFFFLLMNMMIALIVGAYESCLQARMRIDKMYCSLWIDLFVYYPDIVVP